MSERIKNKAEHYRDLARNCANCSEEEKTLAIRMVSALEDDVLGVVADLEKQLEKWEKMAEKSAPYWVLRKEV